MTAAARQAQQPEDAPDLLTAREDLREANRNIEKFTSLLSQTTAPGPLLRKIEQFEATRDDALARLEELEEESRVNKLLARITESDVRRLLKTLAEDMELLDRGHLKDFLGRMIEGISLDPATRSGEIRYRIGASGVKVASPRGFEPRLPP